MNRKWENTKENVLNVLILIPSPLPEKIKTNIEQSQNKMDSHA